MAARAPYKTHRQQHLGDFLDLLQAHSWLTWELAHEDTPTLFYIVEPGSPLVILRTWEAEELAQRIADREGIIWLPVPYPGGLERYNETMAEIAALGSRPAKLTENGRKSWRSVDPAAHSSPSP